MLKLSVVRLPPVTLFKDKIKTIHCDMIDDYIGFNLTFI